MPRALRLAEPLTEADRARTVGEKVLAALEEGRRNLNAKKQRKARERQALIMQLALADAQKGRVAWGRPGRIARRLGDISESQVRKILRALACARETQGLTGG